MGYTETIAGTRYVFPDVKTLLAKATPRRSGDLLARIAAVDGTERVAAQRALAHRVAMNTAALWGQYTPELELDLA